MQSTNPKVCLVVLDGWGIGKRDSTDAIFSADTPFTEFLDRTYPHATLRTDGEFVGLPDGQMGNSEVGHMNIGAGRIVFQDLVRIHREIREDKLKSNPVLIEAIKEATTRNASLHFIGLVSDGGVHSHISHIEALCDVAASMNCPAFIHAFTDGRDTDPKSGLGFIQRLGAHISGTSTKIASVIGRYYAMDRDKRWERVKKAYDLLISGTGLSFSDAVSAVANSYEKGITDEFIEASVITDSSGLPLATIRDGDVVICFNFRTDRCREITEALTQRNMPEFGMETRNLHYVTMTRYDDTYENVLVMYEKDNLNDTLGEVISKAGKTQVRIAETEKYPHVTFFFSGGREAVFEGERRLMIHSPKVATYDLQPEMSAPVVADAICDDMKDHHPDFICLNFANTDMVGHTGVFSAIVKAAETVDSCLRQVVETGVQEGYSFIIIADHGNADCAVNPDGTPNTAHTTNPVPVWIIDSRFTTVKDGILADVAPTVLDMLGIDKPITMIGSSLIN